MPLTRVFLSAFAVMSLLALPGAAQPAESPSPETSPMTPSPSSSPSFSSASSSARWIWTGTDDPRPVNRFTWFRKVVDLPELPADATLLFAADSTARLMINGHVLRRKVARYDEPRITAEVVNAGPWLRPGRNVITVLHHNWGDIITFQRTGNRHAGLFVSGSWVGTDDTWKWTTAPQFLRHEKQIIGIAGNAPRIRFPVVMDGREELPGDLNSPDYDDSSWPRAVVVRDGPWKKTPPDPVETPGQREHEVGPWSVLRAGTLESDGATTSDVHAIAEAIRAARYTPDEALTRVARELILGRPLSIRGRAGQSFYVTVDFARPVHGYPVLRLEGATPGTLVDFGYCEIPLSSYDGREHVRPDGWIDPMGVVGKGYADRYICREGAQAVEIPEERTARWMTLHVHFPADGELILGGTGMVKSQFPIKPLGSFECGDPVIEQIVRLCLIHAEVTMTDAYVDTPGREDGQWIEDAQLRALISERWFGDTSLRRFLIRTHAESQREDGLTHPFAPSNYPAHPATYDWSVQWVGTLWDEYLWSGDTEYVRAWWPALAAYWKNVLSRVNEEGLWQTQHVLADIRVGVRASHPRHSSGIVTPMILERLGQAIALAEAVGETEQAAAWREARERMRRAFREYHMVETSGSVPLHVGDRFDPEAPEAERGISQAGQVVAVYTELFTPEESRRVLDYTFPDPEGTPPAGVTRWNNPTFSYRALKALTHAGLTSRAVAHLKERYASCLPDHVSNPVPPVLQGPFGGPLPEYWISRADLGLREGEINTAQPDDLTGSHGWGAVPLYWLHEHLLGVTITQPGGGRLRIAPQAGGLPYVAGWTQTPRGAVHVYYDPQQLRLEITLPADTTAQVVFPPEFAGRRVKGGRAEEPEDRWERMGGEAPEVSGPGRYVFACF